MQMLVAGVSQSGVPNEDTGCVVSDGCIEFVGLWAELEDVGRFRYRYSLRNALPEDFGDDSGSRLRSALLEAAIKVRSVVGGSSVHTGAAGGGFKVYRGE